jgi:flagellar hook protein FlgE
MADIPDMIDLQTPLQGMERAEASLDRVASTTAASSQPSGDTVDLSAQAVAMLQAQDNFGANVKAAQTMDQLTGSLLNT